MKALSIRQPWAWAILHAGKTIENRDWHCSYRGLVWIHASKWWRPREVREVIEEDILEIAQEEGRVLGLSAAEIFGQVSQQLGGIVGRARIVDCVHESRSPWFMGGHGLLLADDVALPSVIPCKGALGFFSIPPDVEQAALAALGEARP